MIISQKRRDQLSIIANILDIAREGIRKTQIMYQANLSFTQLNQYCTLLLDSSLLYQHTVEGKEIYRTTPDGVRFVRIYGDLLNMIKTKPTRQEKALANELF